MNRASLFWNTVKGSLQSSTWIALGRIFDQGSPHNVDSLLAYAQKHRSIFSKASLALRKAGVSQSANEWLPQYLSTAHVPTPDEFRRMRKHVARYRQIYDTKYKPIRDKLHAHTELTGQQASDLYSKTTIREVETLITFLKRLHEAMWQMFHNGRRPVLRSMPYSAARMLKRHDDHSDPWRQRHVQQIIVAEAICTMNALTLGILSISQSGRSRRVNAPRGKKLQ